MTNDSLIDKLIDIIRQHKHDQLPHPFTEAIKAYPELFPGGNDTSGQGALTDSLCDMYLSKITDENNPIDLTPQRLKRMERAFRLAIDSWYEEQAPSQEVMRLPLDEAKAIYEHYNKGAVVDYSNGATLTDADLRRKTRELSSEISVNRDWQKIEDVLEEASRIIDYFANGKTLFVGSGTPIGCLERLNHAMNLVEIMRKTGHVTMHKCDCDGKLGGGCIRCMGYGEYPQYCPPETASKPVSVSLERCSQAVYSEINYGANNYESIAKSVLDIVGVPYHE